MFLYNPVLIPILDFSPVVLRSSRGIQTAWERRPVLHTAPPPRGHPDVTLHSRGTALPSRGNIQREISRDLELCLLNLRLSCRDTREPDNPFRSMIFFTRTNIKRLRAYLTDVLCVIVNIHQVMFAMRELSGPLSLLIEMVTYSSYCNEPFSLGVLQLLKVKKTKLLKSQRDSHQSRQTFRVCC